MTDETIETVECGDDCICSICGKVIKAGESHNERVIMQCGHVMEVLESYHNECPY